MRCPGPHVKSNSHRFDALFACSYNTQRQHGKGRVTRMGIYVENRLHGDMDELWRKTQEPDQHQRWDLRFSEITYLPRPDNTQPQRFLYATRIGFGLRIHGEGESTGNHESADQRVSALRFWSDDPKSLIEEGSGYWKYLQTNDGIRFLTWYDYRTRFGGAGRLFDRAVFRPLIGWATAWSFDRLRLWIEQGIPPAVSLRNSAIHALARLTLASVWLYHGLVPKLILHHPDELAMLTQAGLSAGAAQVAVRLVGGAEVAFGLLLLFGWRSRRLLLANIPLMLLALASVARSSPQYLVAAFNPLTLNLSVIALALAAYLASAALPSARRCLRRPPERNE